MTGPEPPDGLCHCDAFEHPHEPGLIDGETYCEYLYQTNTKSPHLFGAKPPGDPVT